VSFLRRQRGSFVDPVAFLGSAESVIKATNACLAAWCSQLKTSLQNAEVVVQPPVKETTKLLTSYVKNVAESCRCGRRPHALQPCAKTRSPTAKCDVCACLHWPCNRPYIGRRPRGAWLPRRTVARRPLRRREFVRWMDGTCVEMPDQRPHGETEGEPLVMTYNTEVLRIQQVRLTACIRCTGNTAFVRLRQRSRHQGVPAPWTAAAASRVPPSRFWTRVPCCAAHNFGCGLYLAMYAPERRACT
jgi:hypothetical protein